MTKKSYRSKKAEYLSDEDRIKQGYKRNNKPKFKRVISEMGENIIEDNRRKGEFHYIMSNSYNSDGTPVKIYMTKK